MKKFLCYFFHKYILIRDSGVYWYFKCKRCGKMKYQKVMEGYQPIDWNLLGYPTIEELLESMNKLLNELNKEANNLPKKENEMDERKVLNELEKTYNTITDVSRKLGDLRVFEKLCPNTPIDEILVIISNMNDRLKFIYEQINRLTK